MTIGNLSGTARPSRAFRTLSIALSTVAVDAPEVDLSGVSHVTAPKETDGYSAYVEDQDVAE